MSDQLRGVSAFVEAVEAGSFALAAERMRLTRSAVGKSIAKLEQRLGVRLFHRTTRSQSLTEEGQAYYERCVRALAELDAGASALDSGKSKPTGRLRVTVPVLFGRHCIAPVLLELGRRYPLLKIEMSFSDHVAVPDWDYRVTKIVAEGDTVWAYGTYSGTQKGDWLGIPATNQSYRIAAVDIFRIQDGKLAEHWDVIDI